MLRKADSGLILLYSSPATHHLINFLRPSNRILK